MELPLEGRVALVAGGTRGAGRGIAVELGAAGATVYVTGRSTRVRRSEMDRPETIEETGELVTAAGGKGIAVAVDHLQSDQVRTLVERIDAEHGRLDVLVNDVWGADLLAENRPVWEHDLDNGLRFRRRRCSLGSMPRPAAPRSAVAVRLTLVRSGYWSSQPAPEGL